MAGSSCHIWCMEFFLKMVVVVVLVMVVVVVVGWGAIFFSYVFVPFVPSWHPRFHHGGEVWMGVVMYGAHLTHLK